MAAPAGLVGHATQSLFSLLIDTQSCHVKAVFLGPGLCPRPERYWYWGGQQVVADFRADNCERFRWSWLAVEMPGPDSVFCRCGTTCWLKIFHMFCCEDEPLCSSQLWEFLCLESCMQALVWGRAWRQASHSLGSPHLSGLQWRLTRWCI